MSASRAGIIRRSYPSPGFCTHCSEATVVTHYDRTIPAYICEDCAPWSILMDAMLVTVGGCRHPNLNETPNN